MIFNQFPREDWIKQGLEAVCLFDAKAEEFLAANEEAPDLRR